MLFCFFELAPKEEQDIAFIKNVSVYSYLTDQNRLTLVVYDNDVHALLAAVFSKIQNATIESKKSNSKKDEEINTKMKERLLETFILVSGE